MLKNIFVLILLAGSISNAASRVFFDGGEVGNSTWSADSNRDKCKNVASAYDGGLGPRTGSGMISCNANGQVAWNHTASFETGSTTLNYNNEVFIRSYIRRDADTYMLSPDGSPRKLHRFDSVSYGVSDFFLTGYINGSIGSYCQTGGSQCNPVTYWGNGNSGYASNAWHKLEIYMKMESASGAGNGIFRIWIDGVMQVNHTNRNYTAAGKINKFYLMSNWSDCQNGGGVGNDCDANNHLYWDDVEVFSDIGTGASGSMADASISASGTTPPPQPPPSDTVAPVLSSGLPSSVLPAGTASATMSVVTNENATCKFSYTANVAYASMQYQFSTTGSLAHSSQLTGLVNGTAYRIYVRCRDVAGNMNSADYQVNFSVAAPVPPPPPPQPPAQQSVVSLVLINTDTDLVIKTLAAGDILNLATLPSRNLSIAAITSPALVGSVKFGFDANASYRTETQAPYALFGDENGVHYYPGVFSLGAHSVTATPYSGANASGTVGVAKTIAFTVIDQVPDTTAPSVAISAPLAGSTVQGTVSVSSNPTDNVGVVGVQFYLDGALLGAEDTVAPYSVSLNTVGLANGAHNVSAKARDAAGNSRTSALVNFSVNNVVAQGVTSLVLINTDTDLVIKTLVAGDVLNLATLPSRNLSIAAITSPSVVGSVKFGFDANAEFRVEGIAPYALFGDENSVHYLPGVFSLGAHSVTATPYSGASLTGTVGVAKTIAFTVIDQVPDTTAPNVAISAPLAGSTVKGTISVSSNPTDNVGVVGVQFYLDGAVLGAEDTVAPYSVSLNTVGIANGAHNVSARARDAAGNSKTSVVVNFSVNNVVAQSVSSFLLINADTDTVIKTMVSGEVLNLAKLPTRNLNIAAVTSPTVVGSVKFAYDGNANYRIETYAPYAAFDDDGGTNYSAFTPSLGSHTMTATPYTAAGATGTAGTARTITFSVINQP